MPPVSLLPHAAVPDATCRMSCAPCLHMRNAFCATPHAELHSIFGHPGRVLMLMCSSCVRACVRACAGAGYGAAAQSAGIIACLSSLDKKSVLLHAFLG
jgi:hypothetical protein